MIKRNGVRSQEVEWICKKAAIVYLLELDGLDAINGRLKRNMSVAEGGLKAR
jgi:hypothetical protein